MKLRGLVDLSLILILVSHSNGQGWSITVQNTINAVNGTDVIIPCNFTYPQNLHKEDVKVYWKKHGGKKLDIRDNDRNPFVFHTNNTFVLEEYRGKTELIGDQLKGNCSLKIKNIKNNEQHIYVRISTKVDNFSFFKHLVSISVSGIVPVTFIPDITDTLSATFETSTTCMNKMTPENVSAVYPAVFVPVAALLILVFAAGFVFYRKRKRSLVREDSGYYANFSRTTSNQVNREACQKKDNKKFPEPKVIDEPVYINVEMQLKLWLFLLFSHAIHDVQSSRGQWMANVPTRIPALQGSCVVVPCTYTYPKPIANKILNRWKGFWRRGRKIVATNLPKWKLPQEYKKRTQFLGNLEYRNCTMLLDGVRQADVGPFYFRIEMPQYKSFSYTKNAVSIDVIRDPQPPSLSVKVNDEVTASCSVSHTCPSFPPQFSWSRSGTIRLRSKKLNAWKWETVSTLTFNPRPSDLNKPLNCTVRYRGGKQAKSSAVLRI